MIETLRTWAPVLLATGAALPVSGVIVVALAMWRVHTGVGPRRAWRTAGAEVGMIVGTLPWLWMILTPRPGPGGLELTPGLGLAEILTGPAPLAAAQIGGNLLVFAAFGSLAPIRWPLPVATIAALAAAGSTTVELLQFALPLGRVSSVDDLALNTAGAVLGALLSRRWWLSRRATPGSRGARGGPGHRRCRTSASSSSTDH